MTEAIKTFKILDQVEQPKALFVFAHGAGADCEHSFMREFAERLNEQGINVLRFNFSYMEVRKAQGNRRPPDRMPKLLNCFASILDDLDVSTSLPIFIGGKSMGSRVAVSLACNSDELMSKGLVSLECLEKIKGVICLGYPFHPQKSPEKLRLSPLQNISKPVLVVQGERDALGSEIEVSQYDLTASCQLKFLPDGDHSLKPRVKSGFTHQQHIETAINTIMSFIDENK